jgi:ribosomal protein L11 methyltransferase
MSKPTFSLTVSSTTDTYDTILSRLDQPGFLGCEEDGSSAEIRLTAHFKTEQSAQEAKERLSALLPCQNIGITRTEPQDWNAKWRESMKPARIACGYYVSPLWLPPPKTCRHWIKIEPKMAFGTGHHETTRLAARAIISLRPRIRGTKVLDIGAGSGVLCFVADLCGASFSLGVEIDPDCRENIAENLKNNRSAGCIAFLIGSIDALGKSEHFDLVVMNMLLTESAPLLRHVSRLLKPKGHLIWAGILTEEYKETISLVKPHGLRIITQKEENEWWCGTFEKV